MIHLFRATHEPRRVGLSVTKGDLVVVRSCGNQVGERVEVGVIVGRWIKIDEAARQRWLLARNDAAETPKRGLRGTYRAFRRSDSLGTARDKNKLRRMF
ncbi:MAG: hypothetical protein AAGH41_14525, partial [Pseudomonadota bacterium]